MPVQGEVAVNFNVDLTSIMQAVLNHAEERNDLAVIIQNGTQLPVAANHHVTKGNIASYRNNNNLTPAKDNGDGTATPSLYAYGIDAAGNGSETKLYVGNANWSYGFYFRTPPNRENRFAVLSWGWPKGAQDVINSLDPDALEKSGKLRGANSGWVTDRGVDGVDVAVSMTTAGGSVATAEIRFTPAPIRQRTPPPPTIIDKVNDAVRTATKKAQAPPPPKVADALAKAFGKK